jgi:hypothetical protein
MVMVDYFIRHCHGYELLPPGKNWIYQGNENGAEECFVIVKGNNLLHHKELKKVAKENDRIA